MPWFLAASASSSVVMGSIASSPDEGSVADMTRVYRFG